MGKKTQAFPMLFYEASLGLLSCLALFSIVPILINLHSSDAISIIMYISLPEIGFYDFFSYISKYQNFLISVTQRYNS